MTLPLPAPFPPMEALTSSAFPEGAGWQYEPKWDGFRCLVFRDGAAVKLQSKAGKWLTRYFPEVVAAVRKVPARRFVLDGELVIALEGALHFDLLLQRIHPAESRINRLAAEIPAHFVAFDLLALGSKSLVAMPLSKRRAALEQFAKRNFTRGARFSLSPAVGSYAGTRRWLRRSGNALDGLIAKRVDEPYRSGERRGMQKLKFKRTADCIVGGFRSGGGGSLTLLLGLFGEDGLLHHAGHCTLPSKDRRAVLERLRALAADSSFTGAAPGGPSRWSGAKERPWNAVRPQMVCEVEYDHFTGDRFRHGTRFLRWRPDKAARQCTMKQVRRENSSVLLGPAQ